MITKPQRGPQVVGLGMATLDVLLRLREMPTWERGTRLSDFGFDGGGPCGTAIVAAAKLGVRAGFIGSAGNDLPAEMKLRSFGDVGVDLSRLVRREAPEDQIVIVHVHEETGERLFSGVSRPTDATIRPAELDRDYITAAEILHLDGHHLEAAMAAAAWMQAAGKPVVMDGSKTDHPVSPARRALVERVDVLISGSGFAENLTGEADLWDALDAALTVGPSIAVQTEGERGSYCVARGDDLGARFGVPEGGLRLHTSAFPCRPIDTTGAGDVFHGAFIVGMLHGWALPEILTFATAVSAIKCTRLGGRGGIPTFDEVMAFLAQEGEGWACPPCD
jgi:sulfofructose kinase